MAREGLNKATLIGNLGADPELNFTKGGEPVLKLRLATTESYKDRNGERQEKTEWHTCVLWGKRGESLAKILRKGETICVEGSIQYRDWEKDGVKRTSTDIRVRNVVLLGGGDRDGGQRQQRSNFGGGGGNDPSKYHDAPDDFGDDEIPFAFCGDVTKRDPMRGAWVG